MKPGLRVFLIEHPEGACSGFVMRRNASHFDPPTPSAYGAHLDEVLASLEDQVERIRDDVNFDGKYLWTESFSVRTVSVGVRPRQVYKRRWVIGTGQIPVRISFAQSEDPGGGVRVLLPQFEWWFALEEADDAAEVVGDAIAVSLLGNAAQSIHDFVDTGQARVVEWTPKFLRSKSRANLQDEFADLLTVRRIAEEWTANHVKIEEAVGDLGLARWMQWVQSGNLPSVLLVGAPGTGKTTRVRQLAKALRSRRKSEPMTPRVFSTSADRFIAGQKYLGEWEKQVINVIDELAYEGHWLHVDHLPELLRERNGPSIADFLGPAIVDGRISLIAEANRRELTWCKRRAPWLLQHFQIIDVEEPTIYEMPGLVREWFAAQRPDLSIDRESVRQLILLLSTFDRTRAFPGKAMRFLDFFSAKVRQQGSVTSRSITRVFAEQTGLPYELIATECSLSVQDIASRLQERVIGQDHACIACSRAVARLKAGLDDPERPCGTFLFVGPTGVGKTELSRQLASFLFGDPDRMLRFDMSEYGTRGSAMRLIDASTDAKSLATQVRENPLSLILFDEIEKAHPEVFDLLLGLLGEGRLTDSNGRLVDCRMTIVVMTSNLGVSERGPVGFGESKRDPGFARAVRDHFRPEFFNRIDDVITFASLTPENIEEIVELETKALTSRTGFAARNLRVFIGKSAARYLAEHGWHPLRGARPLKRLIEEKVVTPIAVRMAEDPGLEDRDIHVVYGEDEESPPGWMRLPIMA